jgi:hypothetical protein
MKHQVLFCAHCNHPFSLSAGGVKRMPNGVLAYHHLDGCDEVSELAPGAPTPDGDETFLVVGPITANPDGG